MSRSVHMDLWKETTGFFSGMGRASTQALIPFLWRSRCTGGSKVAGLAWKDNRQSCRSGEEALTPLKAGGTLIDLQQLVGIR